MLQRRLEALWVKLGPEGMETLDKIPKIYPAHKTGESKQLLVRDPARWKDFQASKKAAKEKHRKDRRSARASRANMQSGNFEEDEANFDMDVDVEVDAD